MIDHLGLKVHDLAISRRFYEAALKPLGFSLVMHVTKEMTGSDEEHLGYGAGKPDFWLTADAQPQTRIHIAFTAPDRKSVDAFYAAAMAAGGRDNGPPGLRPQYHASYYGAFVLDPDGNNVEAVCHRPEQG